VVNVGPLEILVVAIIALIVLGPSRLPDVARSVGRGMREFRTALNSAAEDDPIDDEDEDDDELVEQEDDEDDELPPLPTEPPGADDDEPPVPGTPEDLPEGR
jgi:sec-independent protein translocase protein TatA